MAKTNKHYNGFVAMMSEGTSLTYNKKHQKALNVYTQYLKKHEKPIDDEGNCFWMGIVYEHIAKNNKELNRPRKMKAASKQAIIYYEKAGEVFKKSRKKRRYFNLMLAHLKAYLLYRDLDNKQGMGACALQVEKYIDLDVAKMKKTEICEAKLNEYISIFKTLRKPARAEEIKKLLGKKIAS